MASEPRKLARRYHVHAAGLLYIGVTVILGVGSINSQNNLLFIVFGVALGALVFSGLLSGAMLMGLTVERRTPTPGALGEPLRLTYTLRNANRFVPALALTITELPAPRAVAPSRRWTRLIEPPRAFVAQVGPRDAVTAHADATTLRRGSAHLDAIVVSSSFPFGIFRKSVRVAQRDQLFVTPDVRTLSPGLFRNILPHARATEQSASQRGRGDDFYGLRDYVRGDSPRLIAWKASARSGSLVTRLTAEHTASELRLLLLLAPHDTDDHTHTAERDELRSEQAISLAASVIDAALRRSMHVGLAIPQASVAIAPANSPRHRQALLNALALIDLPSLPPTIPPAQARPFGLAGPNLVVGVGGAAHPNAPDNVPALGLDALTRWALDASPPRPGASDPGVPDTPDRGAA